MWIVDVVNYLRSADIPGVGDNVFAFTMTADEPGVMVASRSDGLKTDRDIPNFYKGVMQIIARAHTMQDSVTQAQAVSDLLSSFQKRMEGNDTGLDLGTVNFSYIYPSHLPITFPRSDGDFYESSVNFDVCFATPNS